VGYQTYTQAVAKDCSEESWKVSSFDVVVTNIEWLKSSFKTHGG